MANRILKELKTFTENPAPRSGHRCCATVNHLLVYGGYDKACNDHIYSEILSFNTISRKWTELPHSRNVRFQSASSSMVIYGDSLIIFGGSGYPFGHSNTNDLSVYSLRSKTWSQFRHVKKGNPPIPKYGHSMVISTHKENPKLYIFSGTIGREFLDDMHCFDLESKTWNDIWEEDAPEARYRHEAVVYGDDFYVFGGATYGRALNFHDIWKFNFTSHKWSKLECKPSSKGLFPAPRKAHSCVVWKDTVYMCGGIGHPPEPYNDIWKINLKELKWSKLDIVLPTPLYFHSAAITLDGCLYIFGGVDPSEQRSSSVYELWLTVPSLLKITFNFIFDNLGQNSNHYSTLKGLGLPEPLLKSAFQDFPAG